jgi:hypothetical protein
VLIEQPIYGKEKDAAFRKAEIFDLPSLNENFRHDSRGIARRGNAGDIHEGDPVGQA